MSGRLGCVICVKAVIVSTVFLATESSVASQGESSWRFLLVFEIPFFFYILLSAFEAAETSKIRCCTLPDLDNDAVSGLSRLHDALVDTTGVIRKKKKNPGMVM